MSAATAAKSWSAIGRRKTSTARVEMTEGTGEIVINGRPFEDYLPTLQLQNAVLAPFQQANLAKKFNLVIRVKGGGLNSQSGAIRHAASRALILFNSELRSELKPHGFLRRDPRMKERKKPGQPGARKNFQFSKR